MLTFQRTFISLAVGLCLLTVLAVAIAAQSSTTQDTGATANPSQKNPKLSTPLVVLTQNIQQRTTRPAAGEVISAPPGFSVAALPNQTRDTVRASRMHITPKGEVQVYIEVNGNTVDPQNLQELRSYGVTVEIIGEPKPDKTKGEVLAAVPTVQGLLPLTMINQVSALPFVRYIRLPDYGVKNTGLVDSQGDAILQAEQARNQFGVDGAGIRVGVISDGIGGVFATGCTTCGPVTTETPSPILTGNLPNATGTRNSRGVLTSVSGGIIAQSFRSDGNLEPPAADTRSGIAAEGSAMLEIVHDLAPGAQLYFANSDTELSFEQTVDWITQSTDIGVDDIGWITPPFDGTSPVSVNTATDLNTDTSPIRGYFTAVGNQAFDHWSEPWTDSGQLFNQSNLTCGSGTETGDLELFQATANTRDARNGFDPNFGHYSSLATNFLYLPNGETVTVFLTWNDPWSGSSNDYDLFLFAGNSVACSANPQTGTQPPFEETPPYTNNTGATQVVQIEIVNVNNAAAPRNFDMFVLGVGGEDLNFYTPSGSVTAESDAGGSPVSVVSVGATDAQIDASGDAPATFIEPYSSQGPTEATPQAASRMKPDVTATDGVSVTGAGGFGSGNTLNTVPCAPNQTPCAFFGTSAAAPHVAAVAALVLQAAPCLLSSSTVNIPAPARANLRNFITSTAVPLSGASHPAPNNIEGFGLVNALAAVQTALPKANAGPSQTVNGTGLNGASVTLSGSGSDPDNCPLTLDWSWGFGQATGATMTVTFPLGVSQAALKAVNGGTIDVPASTVQITVTDFTVAGPQTGVSVPPGQASTYTISVGSRFGPFTNPVSLACSGLPALASCAFSPATVTPGSGTTTSTLIISTAAPSSVLRLLGDDDWHVAPIALWLGLLLSLSLAAIFAKRSGRRPAAAFTFGALLVCLASVIASCGGGNSAPSNLVQGSAPTTSSNSGGSSAPSTSGTPAGSYTVTVTGTSNQLQHATTVSLDVI